MRSADGWEMRRAHWLSASFPAMWLASAVCCWLVWNLLIAGASEQQPGAAVVLIDESSVADSRVERQMSYRSSVCDCVRNRTDKLDGNQPSRFDWCGSESTLRGYRQKVVAFSIFGNADKNGGRYYSFLHDNAVKVNSVYPGSTIN